MRTLVSVHSVGTGYADVDAGVLWSRLLDATLPSRQTPPVLTDYLDVTVGGTLAVGGLGGMSCRYGAQIDHVLALTVVTGEGDVVECSMTRNRHLFEATLGGLGQYGIVVQARVRLVPAPAQVRVYTLLYSDLATFTDDQVRVMQEKRFDYVEGQAVPNPAGGWMYLLEAAFYYTPPAQPDDTGLLAGLRNNPGSVTREEKAYRDFAHRLDPLVTLLKTAGAWDVPHPWFDVFVPRSQVIGYIGDALSNLTPADTGNGLVLLYPVPTVLFDRPRLQLPAEPVAFLFDILRFAIPGLSVGVDAMLAANRILYDQVVALGGKRYPIGAIPNYTQQDWKRHYHSEWEKVVSAKRHYDPGDVLTPGQGIFSQQQE
jgi:FAD/FMN-containing dehydrogenase